MGSIVAIASVVLALITAGCIGYIAWEMTADDDRDQPPGGGDKPPGGNSD